jgi:hypothetical protein
MTLQAVPVTIVDGKVRSMDGSTLPRRAHAVLVILPDPANDRQEEWQQPFDEFFALVQSQQFTGLDDVSDEDLNALVHAARQIS